MPCQRHGYTDPRAGMMWGLPLLEGHLAAKKGGHELCSRLQLARPHTQERSRLLAAKPQSPPAPGAPHRRASGLSREALGGTCSRHSDCGADTAQVLTWPLGLASREQDRSPRARPSEQVSGHTVPETLLPFAPQGEDALPSCLASPWARKGVNSFLGHSFSWRCERQGHPSPQDLMGPGGVEADDVNGVC